jgi:hypothetical protein
MYELSAHLDLPAGAHAPAAARRVVESLLRTWGFRDVMWLDKACLVVSELVTGAVQRGSGIVGVYLQTVGQRVIVWAVDGSAVLPDTRTPGNPLGRGVAILQAISAGWGVDEQKNGKRAWAELAPYPGRRRPAQATEVIA